MALDYYQNYQYLVRNVKMNNKRLRIESLDYMRGLMALSVVIYHYTSWSISSEASIDVIGSEYLLGKLGIYGVGVFYILSGISLAIIYDGKIKSSNDMLAFTAKRFFRIAPLFWIAVTIALTFNIIAGIIKGAPYDISIYKVILNYSLSFGFIDPSSALTTGAWSIGNEIVFYTIICITYYMSNYNKYIFRTVMFLSAICYLFFAFIIIDSNASLEEQWSTYINPFNQLFLFMIGALIGKHSNKIKVKKEWILMVCLASLFIFVYYPVSGDKINIVSGINRVMLSAICCIIVTSIYILNPSNDGFICKFLAKLGEISYSIYLMHPIVSMPVLFVTKRIGLERWQGFAISFLIVIVIGLITYRYIETPMMKTGSRIALRIKNMRNRIKA
ncbi:acyltransferase family protein [Klebsiella pneumoniae]|uniref:acyltransferase family protein n=2 Tax=Klebsiella pneumoniae TaxID=573 RepID=UPI001887BDF8|nr:acyltransferase [Klebsiella pneumoniae]